MKSLYKIIIISVIFILCIFVVLLIVRPVLLRSGNHIARLAEEKEKNISLNSELDDFASARDEYYLVNAEYERLSMELPEKDDISILTNELYEIARYTVVDIENLSFEKSKIDEKELEKTPVNEIAIDLVLRGTYYEILNYINTIEIMPRIIKVEDIVVQRSGSGDYNDLLAFIIARTYFTNEYYK